MSKVGNYLKVVVPLFPGDMIHDEAPSLHKKNSKVEMMLRDEAQLKRARKLAKRVKQLEEKR